ncbi:MAG: hypothetical protein ACRYG4_26005 [Janthinobacterium lividum]
MVALPSVAPDEIILATSADLPMFVITGRNVSALRDHLKDTDEVTVPVAATGALALLIDQFDNLGERINGSGSALWRGIARASCSGDDCARDQAARSPLGRDERQPRGIGYR